MHQPFIHRVAQGLAYRFLVFRIRRDRSLDLLVDHGDDHVVFWPISRRATRAARASLAPYPRKWGGYAVPRSEWKGVYDALHHGPCPIIGAVTPFGLVIDTP